MPIRDFLKNYTPGDDFTFEAFRDAALEEYDTDETAWRAAVTTRDETITATKADLQKAQAAAWEAHQRSPVTEDKSDESDENDLDAIRSRVFTTVDRK